MTKLRIWLRCLAAAAVLVSAVLLCWQCIDVCLTGNAPDNLDAKGVHIAPVFSAQVIGERLRVLAIPLGICAGVILFAAVAHVGQRPEKADSPRAKPLPKASKPAAAENKRPGLVFMMRAVLYAAAVLFIVLGVMNGGLYDVLVKAVNICTECIGLG